MDWTAWFYYDDKLGAWHNMANSPIPAPPKESIALLDAVFDPDSEWPVVLPGVGVVSRGHLKPLRRWYRLDDKVK